MVESRTLTSFYRIFFWEVFTIFSQACMYLQGLETFKTRDTHNNSPTCHHFFSILTWSKCPFLQIFSKWYMANGLSIFISLFIWLWPFLWVQYMHNIWDIFTNISISFPYIIWYIVIGIFFIGTFSNHFSWY